MVFKIVVGESLHCKHRQIHCRCFYIGLRQEERTMTHKQTCFKSLELNVIQFSHTGNMVEFFKHVQVRNRTVLKFQPAKHLDWHHIKSYTVAIHNFKITVKVGGHQAAQVFRCDISLVKVVELHKQLLQIHFLNMGAEVNLHQRIVFELDTRRSVHPSFERAKSQIFNNSHSVVHVEFG